MGAAIIWLSTKYIARQELGFIGTLTNNAVLWSQVLLLGLHFTLTVYIHKYTEEKSKSDVLISLSFLIPIAAGVLVAVPYFFFKEWFLRHFQPADRSFMEKYYLWLPLFTMLFIFMNMLEQYLSSQMKVAIAAFMREVVLRIVNIFLIVLFAGGYINFSFLVAGTVLIYTLPVIILLILSTKTKQFGISFRLSAFSRTEYKELLHFSWYHFLLSMSILLMNYMDAVLLPFYDHEGFTAVAVYRVAVFLIAFLLLPQKALVPASYTTLAKAFADNDIDHARNIFVRSTVNIFIPTIFIAVLLACNLPILTGIMKVGYEGITLTFIILFGGTLVNVATGMNDQVLSIAKYYKFNFYLSLVLSSIQFVLLRMLIPLYGTYGAATATAITIILFNIAKCIFVWKKLGMQPFSINTLKIIACGIPAAVAGLLLPRFWHSATQIYLSAFVDASLRSLLITVVYVAMLLWLKPSEDLITFLASVRKNKRLF